MSMQAGLIQCLSSVLCCWCPYLLSANNVQTVENLQQGRTRRSCGRVQAWHSCWAVGVVYLLVIKVAQLLLTAMNCIDTVCTIGRQFQYKAVWSIRWPTKCGCSTCDKQHAKRYPTCGSQVEDFTNKTDWKLVSLLFKLCCRMCCCCYGKLSISKNKAVPQIYERDSAKMPQRMGVQQSTNWWKVKNFKT